MTIPDDHFDTVTELDSTSIFKPKVATLVLTQSEKHGANIMTAAWWMVAGYNPFRFQLAVSHKTYTYEIIEENPEFVMAAPSTEMVDALVLAGKVSGREIDKLDHLDLETIPGADVDVPLLKNAVGNVECHVLDSFEFENCTYYFGTVENAYVVPDGLDGRILSLDSDILAYMGSDWVDEGTETKHRFYADMEEATFRSFPDDDVMDTLPE